MAVPSRLEQACETGMGRDDVAVAALEQLAPLARDRVRVLEVLLEQVAREARVQAVDVSHYVLCSNEAALPEGMARDHGHRQPDREAGCSDRRPRTSQAARSGPPIPTAISERQDRERDQPQRPVGDPGEADEDRQPLRENPPPSRLAGCCR